MTNEEIIAAFKKCTNGKSCAGCPYYISYKKCKPNKMLNDVIDVIDSLNKENAKLKKATNLYKA